ncbi:MAG: polysaccharide deacetylase family protein [Pirellulales bacterium]
MFKPIANLSIDLDNKWAYLRTAQKPVWQEMPTYLGEVVPRIISHLALANMECTVFIVGRDLESASNAQSIRELHHAGHRIANHSYEHEPWLHIFDEERLHKEIVGTHELIANTLGVTCVGFRGPGYSDSPKVHEILEGLGYRYCASAFPSCVGPIARAFYLMKTGLKRDRERKEMFGSFQDAFGKNRPYLLPSKSERLWMVPVTTQPLSRLPIHFTYLFYLSQFSIGMARLYYRMSLAMCRRLGVPPSLLLHPLDFLGKEDEPELGFFPGMKLSRAVKLQQLDWFLAHLAKHFRVHSMEGFLDRWEANLPQDRHGMSKPKDPVVRS